MKRMFNIALLIIAACVILLCSCENKTEWKSAYSDFIKTEVQDKDGNGKEIKYALVKLDNDDIPELLYSGEGYVGTHVCWLHDGKVKQQFVSNENFLYYEKKNLFYGFYFNHGVAHEMVYKLENSNLNKLFENTYDLSGEEPRYLIGKKVVSIAEYDKSVDKYFDKNNATKPDYINGKNMIIEQIIKY